MKYLRKINESEEVKYVDGSHNMLKFLTPDKLNESIDTFDEVLNSMTSILDKYEVIFKTAYGSQCFMTYDDFKEKNNKYFIFINGLPVMGYNLEIDIRIDKYDIDLISEIMSGDYYEFINRIDGSSNILKHSKTNISINTSEHYTPMRIGIELKGTRN
jgi:hypothetical protein